MKKRKYTMAYKTCPGWYILQANQISVKRLDGLYEIIKPYNIVQRVAWIDTESVFARLWRKLMGEILIKLPSPGIRFATIDRRFFEQNFKPVQQPRSKWPYSQC